MTWFDISRRLGSRWCCSWQVGVTLIVLGLVFNAGWGLRMGTSALLRSVGIELLADGVGAVALVIAALTVLRDRGAAGKPVWLVASAWILIATVRGLTFAALQPDEPARTLNSNVSVWIWAMVVIYLFAARDEVRSRAGELEIAHRRLRLAEEDAHALLAEERQRLVEAVQVVVAREIAELRRLVATLAQSPARAEITELADRLSAYSSDVVRETSRQLRGGAASLDPDSRLPRPREVSPPRLASAYGLARQPVLIPAILLVTKAISVSILRWDTATLAVQVGAFAAMVVLLWAGRWAIERVLPRPSPGELVASSLLVLAAAVAVVAGLAVARGPAPDPRLVPLPVVGLYVVGVLVTARVLAGVHLRWRAVTGELELANASLAIAIEELQDDLSRTRQQLADVLHGPVQGRLAAASMALRLHADAIREGRDADYAATMATTTTLLDRAIGDLGGLSREVSPRWPSIAAGLEHLTQSWAGLLAVGWSLGDGVDGVVPRSAEFVDGVVDLVSELVTNASRHGDARAIGIVVHVEPDGSLVITATDDGCGPARDVEPGAGLSGVARFSGSWSLARTADGNTRVRLVVRDTTQVPTA